MILLQGDRGCYVGSFAFFHSAQSVHDYSLGVDPFFQKKKGSTKQRATACYKVSGFLET